MDCFPDFASLDNYLLKERLRQNPPPQEDLHGQEEHLAIMSSYESSPSTSDIRNYVGLRIWEPTVMDLTHKTLHKIRESMEYLTIFRKK